MQGLYFFRFLVDKIIKLLTLYAFLPLTVAKLSTLKISPFLPRDAMLSAVYAVVVCLSVRLCVCVSVTLRYCIKTAKR